MARPRRQSYLAWGIGIGYRSSVLKSSSLGRPQAYAAEMLFGINAGNSLWIIDLGPEGGARGSGIVAVGRPEDVAPVDRSHTSRFLRQDLPARDCHHRELVAVNA
jgi:hypothetical protein